MPTPAHDLSAMPNSLAVDVAIIGAGPSGAIAASLLHQQGKRVLVLEKQHFPVFPSAKVYCPAACSLSKKPAC